MPIGLVAVSFRTRLIVFFALIVLVPLAVVGVGLVRVADESRTASTDAALTAAAETGLALFARELHSAADGAREAGRDESLAHALRSGDAPAARRAVDRIAERERLTALSVQMPSGDELAATGHPASPAAARVTVEGPNRALGHVTAATMRPRRFVTELSELTGSDVVLLRDDRVIAGTVDVEATSLPSGEEAAEVELDRGSSSALAAVPEGAARGVRIAILAPRESGIATSPPLVIAAAAAFLALGLAFVVLLVRALGGQVREMLAAARRIGGGDFTSRVPVSGNDELAGLAREFNTMSERLGRQMDELRRKSWQLERSVRRTGEAFAAGGDRQSVLDVASDAALSACDAEAARTIITGASESQASAGATDSHDVAAALRAAEDMVLRDGAATEPSHGSAFAFALPVPGPRGTRGRRAVMSIARSGSPFDASAREALRYLASQVAVALENIELQELVSDEADPHGPITTEGPDRSAIP